VIPVLNAVAKARTLAPIAFKAMCPLGTKISSPTSGDSGLSIEPKSGLRPARAVVREDRGEGYEPAGSAKEAATKKVRGTLRLTGSAVASSAAPKRNGQMKVNILRNLKLVLQITWNLAHQSHAQLAKTHLQERTNLHIFFMFLATSIPGVQLSVKQSTKNHTILSKSLTSCKLFELMYLFADSSRQLLPRHLSGMYVFQSLTT
jgi:hypothetical protein